MSHGAGKTVVESDLSSYIGVVEASPLELEVSEAFSALMRSGDDNRAKTVALKWLEDCAGAGSVRAALNLGSIFFYGNFGVRVNQKTAIKYWGQAAEAGDDFAIYNMAICYIQGQGVEKDKKHGVALLEKAAVKHYPKAAYNLAYFYRLGDDEAEIERDIAKALWLYYQAITLPPRIDPAGRVAEEAGVNFRLAINELRGELNLGSSISTRLEAISEGMRATVERRVFDLDFFTRACAGEPKAFGMLEGMFVRNLDEFASITAFRDHLDGLQVRRAMRVHGESGSLTR